jgi:murein DD-endopeptidase MepM/ murein hydrolase activator NlpD
MSDEKASILKEYLLSHPENIGKVVDFDRQTDRLVNFDFTANNEHLSAETIADTEQFSIWINDELKKNNSRYGIGGYDEHRTLYARSNLFGKKLEARSLHLGVDIWGPAETLVYNPIDGVIHSFQFNDHFGDYGATIILEHQLGELKIHSLYGHLNLASLKGLQKDQFVPKGKQFAEFGLPNENGHWPPHLHFQLILDMQQNIGDYPGVCSYSQREFYLENCPDPNGILNFTFY